jgi:hypothetical protein
MQRRESTYGQEVSRALKSLYMKRNLKTALKILLGMELIIEGMEVRWHLLPVLKLLYIYYW